MLKEIFDRHELENILCDLCNIQAQSVAMQDIIEQIKDGNTYDFLPIEKRPKWIVYGMAFMLEKYVDTVRVKMQELIEGGEDLNGLAGRTDVAQLSKEKDVPIEADSGTGNKETAKR